MAYPWYKRWMGTAGHGGRTFPFSFSFLSFPFYRAACNADAVLWWEFCPSVCLSHAWIVTKR